MEKFLPSLLPGLTFGIIFLGGAFEKVATVRSETVTTITPLVH